MCVFDVVGASRDWVAIQFSRLPENVCEFAQEVYLFCPDTVTQGAGFTDRHNNQKIQSARQLCPGPISSSIRSKLAEDARRVTSALSGLADSFEEALQTEVETGIRLLAYELSQTRFLFLWWD